MSESWASATRMAFNTSKCKVMVLNGPFTDVNLKLYNDTLQIVDTYCREVIFDLPRGLFSLHH